MARNRKKVYEQGDRINIYLSRDLTPEFIEWINTQSDLSNFFLYAAQQLYQQTGFIDVSEVMPRKINFELSSVDNTTQLQAKVNLTVKKEANTPDTKSDPGIVLETEEKKNDEKAAWSGVADLDDPYA